MRCLSSIPMVVVTAALACGGGSGGGGDGITATDVVESAQPDAVVEVADHGTTDPAPTDSAVPTDTVKDTAKPDVSNEAVVLPDVPVQPQCPTMFTGGTCLDVVACVVQCDDASYQTECQVQADQATKDKIAAIIQCVKDAKCDGAFDDNNLSDCASKACGDLFSTCFAGTGKCKDIWACRRDCNPDDKGCPMKCFGLGSPEAQSIWITYKNCIEQDECTGTDLRPNGWPTETCENSAANHYCPNQHQACIPPQ